MAIISESHDRQRIRNVSPADYHEIQDCSRLTIFLTRSRTKTNREGP